MLGEAGRIVRSARGSAKALAGAALLTSVLAAPTAAAQQGPREACAGDAGEGRCSAGAATGLHASLTTRLPTEIDTGVLSAGKVKLRARFTIAPAGDEPLLDVDMPEGALLEARWKDAGYIELAPRTGASARGTVAVGYTLLPNIEASLYGFTFAYDATTLLSKLPGGSFGFEASGSGPISPWGTEGGAVTTAGPPLDKSTLFALPLSSFGVPESTVTGTLALQATTSPTFRYQTTSIRLDGAEVDAATGVARVAARDADAMDVVAIVAGELSFDGTLDVRPNVKIDSVRRWPTFGLVKFGFTAVKVPFSGVAPVSTFEPVTVHVPLPNVKVPKTPAGFGNVQPNRRVEESIDIKNTGELGAVLRFESSDPRFTVPSGDVRVNPKSAYDLRVGFVAESSGPAGATITVRSNDPDSPVQTFRVGANGASLAEGDEDGVQRPGEGMPEFPAFDSEDGCSVARPGSAGSSGASGGAIFGVLLALGLRARRSRRG